jgi:uncharacterized membrane protein
MNIVHIHLLLNHVPVIGALFAVLLLAFALAWGSKELVKPAFVICTLLGVVAVVVFLTGEPAEKIVEKLPGFSDSISERHEEIALIATTMMAAFGALTLLALLVYRRRPLPRRIAVTGLIVAIGVSGIMAYTANLGGQIRHTEIRSGSIASDRADRPSAPEEATERGGRR